MSFGVSWFVSLIFQSMDVLTYKALAFRLNVQLISQKKRDCLCLSCNQVNRQDQSAAKRTFFAQDLEQRLRCRLALFKNILINCSQFRKNLATNVNVVETNQAEPFANLYTLFQHPM